MAIVKIGQTALKTAVKKKHFEIMEKFSAKRSNIDVLSLEKNGRTSLQAAIKGDHLKIVEKPLAVESNINVSIAWLVGFNPDMTFQIKVLEDQCLSKYLF